MDQVLQHAAKKINITDFRPEFFDLKIDKEKLTDLLKDDSIVVLNTIEKQIGELIKTQTPSERFSIEQLQQKVVEHLNGTDPDDYGVWVYYPWSKRLVHLLGEEEFISVRTSRNMYKITPQEQSTLRSKKIAIIGLSVGQSIAQTIATERICGELRLADFDTLELGNLNRLSAGVQDLGVPKVVIAARKIAEIDPFIKVKCWPEGINEHNLEDFLSGGGNASILVEECDGFDIKVASRIKAREKGIPVIMDTNDIGMLDVERFDLEPTRPIFHGKAEELNKLTPTQTFMHLKNLTFQEKFGYLTKIIGFENTSEEMKVSLSELNKTITGWPQLASAVTLGAAIVSDACRRILLGKFTNSGRFFVHFNELIK